MADIQRILSTQSLVIDVKTDWGSHNPEYRTLISEASSKHKSTNSNTSISHADGLGGFAALQSDEHWQIGFDIERIDRVTPSISRRVSFNKEEFGKAPSAESLWTAKEATFKALLGPKQPLVISKLHIGDWRIYDSHIETYRLLNIQDFEFSAGFGLVFKKYPFCLSFFISRP